MRSVLLHLLVNRSIVIVTVCRCLGVVLAETLPKFSIDLVLIVAEYGRGLWLLASFDPKCKVNSMVVNQRGELVVCSENNVRVFSPRGELLTLQSVVAEHIYACDEESSLWLHNVALDSSGDGKMVFTAYHEAIKGMVLQTNDKLQLQKRWRCEVWQSPVSDVAEFNGTVFYIDSTWNRIQAHDHNGVELDSLRDDHKADQLYKHIAVSPAGELFASFAKDCPVAVFDALTRSHVRSIRMREIGRPRCRPAFDAHGNLLCPVFFQLGLTLQWGLFVYRPDGTLLHHYEWPDEIEQAGKGTHTVAIAADSRGRMFVFHQNDARDLDLDSQFLFKTARSIYVLVRT